MTHDEFKRVESDSHAKYCMLTEIYEEILTESVSTDSEIFA